MEVELLIHMDIAGEVGSQELVWWAESPAVPGFTAAAGNLPALLSRAHDALSEILGEDLVIKSRLTGDTDANVGDGAATIDKAPPQDVGVDSRRRGPLVPA